MVSPQIQMLSLLENKRAAARLKRSQGGGKRWLVAACDRPKVNTRQQRARFPFRGIWGRDLRERIGAQDASPHEG